MCGICRVLINSSLLLRFERSYPAVLMKHISADINHHRTGWSRGNSLALYSRGARFESQPGHRLSWLRIIVVICSPSRQMPDNYFDQATTASFQIIFNSSLIINPTNRLCIFSILKAPLNNHWKQNAMPLISHQFFSSMIIHCHKILLVQQVSYEFVFFFAHKVMLILLHCLSWIVFVLLRWPRF
jgi:hypothetical protein